MGSLLLATVTLAPLALAHNDTDPWVGTLLDDQDGYDGPTGFYYTSHSGLVQQNGNLPSDPAPDTDAVDEDAVVFALGVASGLCDMEILGSGNGFSAEDEDIVEGLQNTVPSAFGEVTLFNDGGMTAVCHTVADGPNSSGYYETDGFNEAGCTGYDPATGKDLVSPDVWLTTVCSYGYSAGDGVGITTYTTQCLSGAVLTQDLDQVGNCVSGLAACFVDNGENCALNGSTENCGSLDGTQDLSVAGSAGWGSAGVAFPTALPNSCTNDDASAQVFVWTAVIVDISQDPVPTQTVSAPTIGMISH